MTSELFSGAPGDWQTVRLRDVATFGSGTTPSRTRQEDYFTYGKHLWVKTLDLNNSVIRATQEKVTDLALEDTSLKIYPESTVLVAMYGGYQQIGRTGILSAPASVNQAITAVIADQRKMIPAYLLHALNYRVGYWRSVASSSRKDPNITGSDVKDFPVLLPSTSEQEIIAEAVSDVDRFIIQLERLIAKKRAISQGMRQQLLTGKVRLPGFNDPWHEILLGNHVNYLRTVALSRAQLDDESPVRYLHYGDIHTRCGVTLDAAYEPMPRANTTLLRNAGRLQVGDLVFADASEDPDGVGKSVEVTSAPEAGVVPGLHTIAARFDKSVLADGFKAYLQFIPVFRSSLLRLASGTKVLAITRSFISSITLTLPSLDEQRAIASAITDADQEINILLIRLTKARELKQGMMQQLLPGRTRLPLKEGAA
ncbi:restriction endonuclease subunit S [Streptomyces sp. NPDC127020]|uniref:restriction endonuclease subunit S n=1 Tax=Streptomyces sp. NPDC127020 TaxID=3347109 RepID=UPI00365BD6FB